MCVCVCVCVRVVWENSHNRGIVYEQARVVYTEYIGISGITLSVIR